MNTYKKYDFSSLSRLAISAIAVLVLCSQPLSAETARRAAFAVGIGEYAEYPVLKAAAGDAHAISRTLTDRGFDAVTTATNEDVSYSRLYELISNIAGSLKENDLLVLYVAAHGWVDRNDGTALILPSATRRGFEREDGIDLAKLIGEISNQTDARIVVMLDACFAGAFNIADHENRLTFWAGARANEWAFEDRSHGLFTGQILKYLNGKSRRDIATSVTQGVVKETGGWQIPVLSRGAGCNALAML